MKRKLLPTISSADRHDWVKQDFDQLATRGFLGDPAGLPAMAYLRVSSAGQAEEGRSGFPRQLLHVHEKALTLQLAIPWQLVFFDDHTGFEFRDRPDLLRLRELVKTADRPARDLVIENLDRLSREATWHQGFLLDELEKEHKVRVHFWKELGSKLERVVYGTIAQDRMLTDLERMATGNLMKARSGRVTARTPAFGYKLVNSQGGEENVKKDTHYAVFEEEAQTVRRIYELLVKNRLSLLQISRLLTDEGAKLPKQSQAWDTTLLYSLIRNTVYRGQFFAHRSIHVKRISRFTGREVIHKIQRPREEWIAVDVPAIIPPDIWEAAQAILENNKLKSRRNSKQEYLLASFLFCAECQAHMAGKSGVHYKRTRTGNIPYRTSCYKCGTSQRPRHLILSHKRSCTMGQISSKVLDAKVWTCIREVLFDPERLRPAIDRYFSKNGGDTSKEELAFVQSQLTELDLADERLYQAYMSGAFNAEEYADKRAKVRDQRQKLEAQKEELYARWSRRANQEHIKQSILDSAAELKQRAQDEISFDLKRRIIMAVVERITVNVREEWFEIEGAINGRFDFVPADRGSALQPA